mmetsp:Transcript_39313/g.76957  ORF Transcript_39313/g.76957 Transcript_39313/m.76957 type:complete len:95 (+) Transcript_39313:59-343(+)|eukprot:CAMPEP_0173392524 /NCGR_PEP_ID=MMETSP1356-20130122/19976_1 /TAXON_ID=77927 ORGANISM="Hemiselmis virescens, Strain PCC157" /NCGR_SAMPLE_ID=MMETSP1356 /ASSEMBLY_ACC=CAM_ASM_000847 /LENGTH=94 /DNA_ID=CAMNT_0014350339 /DNA_START=49 /DNA_END=333 /DNA_ORIENTATION=-
MFADIHRLRSSSLAAAGRNFTILLAPILGDNGYPIDQYTDCVDPVKPEDWLSAFTNSVERADALNAKGLTANTPTDSSSEPPGNNVPRMCFRGY